jgi:hypothetical protein
MSKTILNEEHDFRNEEMPDGSWYTLCFRCWQDDRGESDWMEQPCPGDESEEKINGHIV